MTPRSESQDPELTPRKISHCQRILGSYRKGSLPACRRHTQLVLLEDCQGKPHQERSHQIQLTRALQPENRHCFTAHGRHDYRRHVHPQLICVSLLSASNREATVLISHCNSYIQFHPLAYMVKLNIEMTMANLIKRIAISTSRKTGMHSMAQEFRSSSELSTGHHTGSAYHRTQRASVHELSSFVSCDADTKAGDRDRIVSFAPVGNQIKKTREVIIRSEVNPYFQKDGTEVEITSGSGALHHRTKSGSGVVVEERVMARRKSMESIAEGNESMKSMKSTDANSKKPDDSDDETALVGNKAWWPRAEE